MKWFTLMNPFDVTKTSVTEGVFASTEPKFGVVYVNHREDIDGMTFQF
jgi:hypothetical protein